MIHPTDNTQGDLRLLAMAIQALIETHPNKNAFHEAFLKIEKNPNAHSLYAGAKMPSSTAQLLQDLLRTGRSQAELQQGPKS